VFARRRPPGVATDCGGGVTPVLLRIALRLACLKWFGTEFAKNTLIAPKLAQPIRRETRDRLDAGLSNEGGNGARL
jgi:hypothetical protein